MGANRTTVSAACGASGCLQVIPRTIGTLQADPRNARLHPPKHVQQLAKSITTFGFNVPILVDTDGRVIAGHGRLLAAQKLGWTEVPTITLEHLTPDQVRAYRIADNRLTDCSTWDERLLAEQLRELAGAELDFDLEAIGFEMPEIDLRIQSLGELDEQEEPADSTSAADEPVVSIVGDVWQLGSHRIACGSALEPATYETLLQGERAAVVFTDPPYNVPIAGHVGGKGAIQHHEFPMASGEMSRSEFTTFLGQALAAMKSAVSPGALMYVCMDWRHIAELAAAGEGQGLELKNVCCWDKGCGGMGSLYRSQHDLVFVFKSGSAPHTNNVQLGRFGRNRSNVWSYPGVNSFARETGEGNLLALHPTVKPVALVADALLDASGRGELVLDPFLGSGTTIIAAEKTGRRGYGIELDPRYVDTAIRRWQRLTGQHGIHLDSGQRFCDLERERQGAAVQVDYKSGAEARTLEEVRS
jgi:DNA modification methylase